MLPLALDQAASLQREIRLQHGGDAHPLADGEAADGRKSIAGAERSHPHRFLQLHLRSYLEEMRRLNAGGEEDRVDISLADGFDGCPKGSQIVRKRPLVNGHACNRGSSFAEP